MRTITFLLSLVNSLNKKKKKITLQIKIVVELHNHLNLGVLIEMKITVRQKCAK